MKTTDLSAQIHLRSLSDWDSRGRDGEASRSNHPHLPHALHLRIRLRTSLGVGCAADEKYDSDHRALHLQFWTARLRCGAEEPDHGLGQALG